MKEEIENQRNQEHNDEDQTPLSLAEIRHHNAQKEDARHNHAEVLDRKCKNEADDQYGNYHALFPENAFLVDTLDTRCGGTSSETNKRNQKENEGHQTQKKGEGLGCKGW